MTKTTRLLAFGDSFVAGVGDADCRGWVGRTAAAACARGAVVLPFALGIPGQTSAEIAARWRAEAEARQRADAVLRLAFSFGANDCNTADHGGPRLSLDATLKTTEALLDEAVTLAPVVVIGPLPVLDDPAVDARVAALCPALEALCAGRGVPYLPVFDRFRAEDAWVRGAAAIDGTHSDAAGYAVLASVIDSWPAWRAHIG